MTVHAMAATVISTAVLSAGATTVVNQMIFHRRRRIRHARGFCDHQERVVTMAETVPGPPPSGSGGESAENRPTVEVSAPDADLATLSATELERLAGIAWRDGDYPLAKREYEEVLARARAAAATAAEARALTNLGTVHDRNGDPDAAIDCFTGALGLYRTVGDGHGEAEALTSLGLTLRRQGRHREARSWLREAQRLHHDNGDRYGEASVMSIMAELKRDAGDLGGALRAHRRALDIYCELSRADAESMCLNDCASTLFEQNHPESAMTTYANALTVARRVGADTERARAHDGIATILYTKGDRTGARSHWSRSWHLFREVDRDRAEAVAAQLRLLD